MRATIKLLPAFVFILVMSSFQSRDSVSDKVMYDTALGFLNSQFKKSDFDLLWTDCLTTTNHLDTTFFSTINVSKVKIANEIGPAFCDLVDHHYSFAESCGRLIASDAKELNSIRDSLARKQQEFRAIEKHNRSHDYIKSISNGKEIGVVAFFSSINNSTMSVELMSFCSPYSTARWQGSSTYYYLTFDKGGNIGEVFRGGRKFD